jgi:hypothetical protein
MMDDGLNGDGEERDEKHRDDRKRRFIKTQIVNYTTLIELDP